MGRNVTVLICSLVGVILLVSLAFEDPPVARGIAGAGCFLLARIYWKVTEPRGRYGRE